MLDCRADYPVPIYDIFKSNRWKYKWCFFFILHSPLCLVGLSLLARQHKILLKRKNSQSFH